MNDSKLFIKEKTFNSFRMNPHRGKVVKVTTETQVSGSGSMAVSNGYGSGGVSISSKTFTTIHVVLDNGMQKSFDITETDIHFIEGNDIFLVLTDDSEIVFLKNYASGLSVTAEVASQLPTKSLFKGFVGLLALPFLFALCVIGFKWFWPLGIVAIFVSLYILSKIGLSIPKDPIILYNKKFQDLLVSNEIDLKSCVSVLYKDEAIELYGEYVDRQNSKSKVITNGTNE